MKLLCGVLGNLNMWKNLHAAILTRYPVPEAQCNYFTCSRSQINRVGKSLLVSEALQFSQLTAITMKTPCHRDHASKYGWISSVPYSHVVFTVCDCFFVKHTGTSGKNGHQRLIEKGVNCMISDANLRSVLIHNFKKNNYSHRISTEYP